LIGIKNKINRFQNIISNRGTIILNELKKTHNSIVYDTIISRRSIRRYKQKPIDFDFLKRLVNAARLAPSGANLQPLEFIIVKDRDLCAKIFDTIGWAGYISPKWKPKPEERPTAYIVIIINNKTNPWYQRDVGLASANIILTAEASEIGSCILCRIDKDRIKKILNIPTEKEVDSVISLGYKDEAVVVEDIKDSVEYWRDEKQILHVPKRKLEDILHTDIF
jgi:nitroreductase